MYWLSLHNLPEALYHWMTRWVLKNDGHAFITYQEFVEKKRP